MVDLFGEEYKDEPDPTTLSAIDLSRIPALASAVDGLGLAMLDNLAPNLDKIKEARRNTISFHFIEFKDLRHYASQINQAVTDPTIQSNTEVVINSVDNTIIAKWKGGTEPKIQFADGITISVGVDGKVWNIVGPHYGTLDLAQDTAWDAFIDSQTDTPGISLVLEGSPLLVFEASDTAGNSCGVDFVSDTGSRCGLPDIGETCNAGRVLDQTYITHPLLPSISWKIDGAFLQEDSTFNLKIQVIEEDGIITQEEIISGIIQPFQIVSDIFTTTLEDTTEPETTIDSAIDGNPIVVPDGGSTISDSMTFAFNGTDDSGIASFECDIDHGGFSACTSPLDLTSLSDGFHNFMVRAIDNANNTDSTPASFSWTSSPVSEGDILVIDEDAGGRGALFSIDPSSGNRILISDFGNAAQGPIGLSSSGVAIDALLARSW